MKKKNITILLSLSLLISGIISSCSDDNNFYYEDPLYVQELTDMLCSRVWVDNYVDAYGVLSEQILEYDPRGYGWETITHFYSTGSETFEYEFYWEWVFDRTSTSIYMEYGRYDYLYFSNITLTPNRLRGYFDNDFVEFVPYFPR